MNKEEMRKTFESYQIKAMGERSEYMLRRLPNGDYCSVKIQDGWEIWQARQPEIEQLKEDNERLFNVIKQAQVLAGGSERDNAHDMDQQLCEIWLLCDKCDQGEK